MKINTIKWKIFKYNLLLIILLIALVTVIFNIAIRVYFEKDTLTQLEKIAMRTEEAALHQGPKFLPELRELPHPPDDRNSRRDEDHAKNVKNRPDFRNGIHGEGNNDIFRFYFMLDRSLKEPLSVLNADYLLLDKDKNRIVSTPIENYAPSDELVRTITDEIGKLPAGSNKKFYNFNFSGAAYTAIIKPVSQENSFGLSWIIIYSSLQKINQLQWVINLILFAILVFSSIIIVIFSSLVAKKISEPFSSLSQHIKAIAERNFGRKLAMPVVDELQGFVNNINIMSEKLETYDKAQKTFLQNASHEFRTPLMSIQSYAEGIKYDVVDPGTAVDIIMDESKRLTHMVEDLMYLSRLDTIEESYRFDTFDINEFVNNCIERMKGIAIKNNIKLAARLDDNKVKINADEEKLSRAITNIIGNCIRYASSLVEVKAEKMEDGRLKLVISDDGPGFEESEIPYIFERFYKGNKGNYGLGLAISKNVIEKHNGSISAKNSGSGAVFIVELPVEDS